MAAVRDTEPWDESELPGPDEDDLDEDEPLDENDYPDGDEDESGTLSFRGFVRICPACKRPVTEDMDNCPYCGDILFRTLRDGTFAPRKGPWTKVFAALVVALVVLAAVMFLWANLR